MNLNSGDRIVHDQAAPLRVNRWRLLKDRKDAFDQPHAPLGLYGREAETTPCCRRPGANVPEFYYILRRAT
jgi:hypothetical protein